MTAKTCGNYERERKRKREKERGNRAFVPVHVPFNVLLQITTIKLLNTIYMNIYKILN